MIILTGFVARLLPGLATAVGALPLLGSRRPTERQENAFLGFAAGVMLAVSFFSLIIPGIEHAQESGVSQTWSAAIVIAAMLIGALFIDQLNRVAPKLDRIGLEPAASSGKRHHRRIRLFVAAITLHNFPEGLAEGVSFGTGDIGAGTATALGIGLQNIPEGLAVGVSLLSTEAQPRHGRARRARLGPARAGRRPARRRHGGDGFRAAALGAGVRHPRDDLFGGDRDHPHTHRTEPATGEATVGFMPAGR